MLWPVAKPQKKLRWRCEFRVTVCGFNPTSLFFFFFNDPPTTEIYPLPLHDALPILAAITPNAKNHAGLSPKASRAVHVDDLPWEKTRFDGCEVKTLLVDRDSGLVTALLRMQPGAVLPDHEHVLIEQTYMIEGRLVDKEGADAGLRRSAGGFSGGGGGRRPARPGPSGRGGVRA